MQCLFEIIIYLLAVLGIILTTSIFFERKNLNKKENIKSIIYKKVNNKDRNHETENNGIEVVIKIKDINVKQEELLMKKVLENNINLKEIADVILLQKY